MGLYKTIGLAIWMGVAFWAMLLGAGGLAQAKAASAADRPMDALSAPRMMGLGQVGAPTPSTQVTVISEDEAGLVLEMRADLSDLVTNRSISADDLSRSFGPELALSAQPGLPQLPVLGVLVGIPPEVAVTLEILGGEGEERTLRGTPILAPSPAPLQDELRPGQWMDAGDRSALAGLYPDATARMGDPVWLRSQRMVRIEFSPIQVDGGRSSAVWHSQIRIALRFSPLPELEQGRREALPNSAAADPFEAILRASLLNYQQARAWRGRPASGVDATQKAVAAPEQAIKITVDRDGIYRLTGQELADAGLDLVAVQPDQLALANQGNPVALTLTGVADGRLDEGDELIFYGQAFQGVIQADTGGSFTPCAACAPSDVRVQPMEATYTRQNVYWLTWQGAAGSRMAQVDARPDEQRYQPTYYTETLHFEESKVWWSYHYTSKDTWFGERIQARPAKDALATYDIGLSALVTLPHTATLRGEVVSFTDRAGHQIQLAVNGETVIETSWDGRTRHRFSGELAESDLQNGQNQLGLTLLNGQSALADTIYPNWFEIDYARGFQAVDDALLFSYFYWGGLDYSLTGFTSPVVSLFDITDPLQPQLLTHGIHSVTQGDLTRLAFGLDQTGTRQILAVGQDRLRSEKSNPVAVSYFSGTDLREPANGADYLIITHRSFYTGVQSLAEYRAGQGLRVKVVDVADVYDEFNQGIFHPRAIRDFLAYAYAHWQGAPPAYVVLVGDGHWNFLDNNPTRYGEFEPIFMPPMLAQVDPWQGEVDSTNLLAAVVGDDIVPDLAIGRLPVNSLAQLSTQIARIQVYERGLYADWHGRNIFVADNVPDDAGDFVALTEALIQGHLPAWQEPIRIYANDYVTNQTVNGDGVRDQIVATVNLTGAHFLNYIGHGTVDRWASEGLFTVDDVALLNNETWTPIVFSLDCLDGYWIYPNRASLAETLVRTDGRGAVAAFGPTGLGVASGHDILHRGLYDGLFKEGMATLGAATIYAKMGLFQSGAHYDLIHTFVLFGDPALRVQRPRLYQFLPALRAPGGS